MLCSARASDHDLLTGRMGRCRDRLAGFPDVDEELAAAQLGAELDRHAATAASAPPMACRRILGLSTARTCHETQTSRPHRPVRLRALSRHHDLRRRRGGHLGKDRQPAAGRRRAHRRRRHRCRHQLHRYRRRLRRRPLRGDHRPGAEEPQGAARERRRRDQGVRRDRHRRQRARCHAQPHHRRAEGELAPPPARPCRPLPDPRVRSGDTDRGDGACARHHGPARPRALRRRLQLGRLADHEGDRHLGAARPGPLREPAGLLHGGRPRPRARADPDAEG